MSESAASVSEGHHAHQGPSYWLIFGALVVLTGLTVGVSYLDFGQVGGVVVAMIIASTKATLVLLFFMHVKFELPSIYVPIGFALVLCVFLVAALIPDVALRDTLAAKYQIKEMIIYFACLIVGSIAVIKTGQRLLRSGT
ncbi:MAG: cytochrome C oxidase subunit IV family protein [Planctomycetota bacterium]|jgi:cytochrome c oxidase subunit 4|nr:cytochrome C oxidase subunit IV family protein [Planctomycetota bacterium]